MLAKRIIPCLDVKDGRTVKGTNFIGLRDAGDPVELAARYSSEGADELVLLDISATDEGRSTFVNIVREVAVAVDIPFTVGGGVSSVDDASRLLEAGADKVSVNTAAVRDPQLLNDCSARFGSQCKVVSVDAKLARGRWRVYLNGGRVATDLDAMEWVRRAVELGAGEVLLTSIDTDGTRSGFANVLTRQISTSLNIPVIASGGAGTMDDFVDVFVLGKADAALAASVFHYNEMTIASLKSFLRMRGVEIRT
jgi:imidazole glycerol-phosphate synthase subunit HisF